LPLSSHSEKTAYEPKRVIARQARRKAAAYLLEHVVTEKMEPRLAINRWPVTETLDDTEDLSVTVAMQALWHFEADEDRHKQEIFYLDAQLDLLSQMATLLKQDRDLPPYMLTIYPIDHRPNFYRAHTLKDKRLFTDFWLTLKATLRPWKAAFQKVWLSTPK
jgi:hypothetical protein